MKKILTILIALSCILLQAQENEQDEDEYRTIFGGSDINISGFGGLSMSFGTIDGTFAHMMGGGGGVIINNVFFGGYGMGLTTEQALPSDPSLQVEFGHGGLWFGYIHKPKKAIHLSAHCKTGWGSIGGYNPNDPDDFNKDYEHTNVVFSIIPTLELEANVSRFFKIGLGGSYHFLYFTSTNTTGFNSEDFQNPAINLSFKFGWFD